MGKCDRVPLTVAWCGRFIGRFIMRGRAWTAERRSAWIAAAETFILGESVKYSFVRAFKRWATDKVPTSERRAWNMRAEDAATVDAVNRATPPNWRTRDLPEACVEALEFLGFEVAACEPVADHWARLARELEPFRNLTEPERKPREPRPEPVPASEPVPEPAAHPAPVPAVPAPPAPLVDVSTVGNALLDTLGLRASIAHAVQSALGPVTESIRAASEDGAARIAAVESALMRKVEERLASVDVTVHEVRLDGKAWRPHGDAPLHPLVPAILARLQAGLHVLAYGPKGSGKTFLCEQVAEALGVPMHLAACTGETGRDVVVGRLTPCVVDGHPSARYEPSAFLRAFECGCGAADRREAGEDVPCVAGQCGGLAVLDEADRLSADVAVGFNSPLANGHLRVPARADKPVALRSQLFYCIATANTTLRGARQGYSAAQAQDSAFAERFACGEVFVGYAEELERRLGPPELVSAVHALRTRVREASVKETVGMRAIVHGARLMRTGASVQEALSAYAQTWSAEARSRAGLPALEERW